MKSGAGEEQGPIGQKSRSSNSQRPILLPGKSHDRAIVGARNADPVAVEQLEYLAVEVEVALELTISNRRVLITGAIEPEPVAG